MIQLPEEIKKELQTTLFFKRDESGEVKAVRGVNPPVASTSSGEDKLPLFARVQTDPNKKLPLDF